MRAPELATEGGVLLVEAAEDVENKRTVSDGLAKIGEVISHTFEALAVVRDGQIALHKSSKPGVKMKSARFLVPKELSLDGVPGGAGGGALGAPERTMSTRSLARVP